MNDLIESYHRQVETAKDKLSATCYESLINRNIKDIEDLEIAHSEYIHSLQHAEYYIILDRIEKGEGKIASESDPAKKSQYSKLLNELVSQMERVRPG